MVGLAHVVAIGPESTLRRSTTCTRLAKAPRTIRYGRLRRSSGDARRSGSADRHLQPLRRQHRHHVRPSDVCGAERRAWFDDHRDSGPHRLLVATDARNRCLGYASSSRWRPKPASDTTVETSVYCHPEALGRGCGTALYAALFAVLASEDVHRVVAGVSLPNPASVSLHERFGFRPVGVFHSVGRKFDRFWDVAWFERPLRGPHEARSF